MPNVDLKQQINWLVRLQAIDTQIYTLEQEKQSNPLKLKALEEALTKEKEVLVELEKKGLDLQKKRKEKELELASREEEARKMQMQLYQLKTNKEYAAKLKEIETVKADASVLEDAILELLEQFDESSNEIKKSKQILAEKEKQADEKKRVIEFRSKEIEDKLHQLQTQRNQVVQQLDDNEILARYERVLSNRDHLAIVKVQNDACQGCFMNVPPQVINLIKMYDNIVICEVCQRILYIEEELNGDLH